MLTASVNKRNVIKAYQSKVCHLFNNIDGFHGDRWWSYSGSLFLVSKQDP